MGTVRNKETAVNIAKSSLVQLKELANRQEKLLSNKKFISTLPDKGAKIQAFYDKILAEIRSKDQVDQTSELLSKITLQETVGDLEWNRKSHSTKDQQASHEDSDDEPDPLKILASHSGTQNGLQRKEERSTPSLVTQKDIEEAKSFKTPSYAQKMCAKYDNRKTKERFKPNTPRQTELAKTGYRSSCENVQKRMGKSWEVTAATPPVPVFDSAEPLTLAASLELQQQQVIRLKEIQLEEATARLRERSTIASSSQLPFNLMAYRTPADPTQLFEGTPVRDKPDELHDDEGVESGGAVFYNIVDDVPDKT